MEEISRVKDGTPTDEELEEVADVLGNWKRLGRRLGVSDSKLQELDQAHDQPSEKAYYTLKHWKQEKGSHATYQALYGALMHNLVQRQDLAERFCYINGPSGSQLPTGHMPQERVTGEVPGATADVYSGISAKNQDDSTGPGVKGNLKRKSSESSPSPDKGKIPCARDTSRNSGNQDTQEQGERKNRYMEEKIEELLSQRLFDLSTDIGIHHFCTHLVGEFYLMDTNFQRSKIKETPSVASTLTTACTMPSPAMAEAAPAAAEAVSVSVVPVESGHEESFFAWFPSLVNKAAGGQTQWACGSIPTKRPDYGTAGRPIRLRANFFRLNISSQLSDVFHYDVEITPDKCPRSVKRDIVHGIIRRNKDTTFQGHHPAFDGERDLYSRIKLPQAELSAKLPGEDGEKDKEFKVKLQSAASVSLLELNNFLSDQQNGKLRQDAVQALDIIMREKPSFYFTPVGRSFFPFDCQGRPLGEGCEVQFGFYSSVRHSEWKAMLVNIDVSAKGFYKEQHVIDFLCDTLGRGVTPQSLENRNFRLDKHGLEKAIRGKTA